MAYFKTLIWRNFLKQLKKKNLWNSFQNGTTEEYFMLILSIELTLETQSFKRVSGKA